MPTFLQQKNKPVLSAAFIITALLFAGCASNDVVEEPIEAVEVDPYENINRKVYAFNETLDGYVAKPISDAYLWITPQFVQTGVGNFFNNLEDINVVLNDLMQGKVEQGAEDTGRFAVNSTIGLLGLFDVATEIGLEKHEEDFAQTLGVWGVPKGPYLVLPILGPSTSRGVPGSVFDTAANPATYVGFPIQAVQMLNARANAEGSLRFIDEAALDPYVFTRESFLQYRKHLVTDGNSEITDDILDLEDEFFEDEGGNASENNENGISKELSADATPMVMSNRKDQSALPGHKLKLSSDTNGFGQASDSFDGAVKSFDDASHSFEQAADKINQLEK